ncbi:MAG: T9SS type A sorting domain-containing protein [Bacteroidales bacterium]|nr:T9SS type A sorting domain-containing protein [Bacteroidales bacterium]
MKKLFLTLSFFAFIFANAQTVKITFTAQDAHNQRVQLDSVQVANLSHTWAETLVWPDTICEMSYETGVKTYKDHAFALSQNTPNPFEGETTVSLQLSMNERVSLSIYDIQGKKVVALQRQLPAGEHLFRVCLSQPQTYLLVARAGSHQASIKMIHLGKGGANKVEYVGLNTLCSNELKASKGAIDKPFELGDTMCYVGYATINGDVCQSALVKQSQTASQTITLSFAETQKQMPTVTTDKVDDIESVAATIYGTVVSDGYDSVSVRGFCWDINPNPTKETHVLAAGAGLGVFSGKIEGLTSGVTYYVRAFADNSCGTAYGNEMTFTTTQKSLPVVRTLSVGSITYESATFYGEVVSDGGDAVTAYGVCWGLQMNPTIESGSFKAVGSGTGSFSAKLEGLEAEKMYYARAYATNSQGTVYGDNLPFKTKAAPEDPREQLIVLCEQATQTYNIYNLKTGEKVWSWNPASNSTVSSSGYRFNNVSDAKPCYNGTCMMVVASGGGAAVVRLEDKKVLFLGNPLGNTHSIEMLPGDRVVCSSTTGNTLKVYNVDPNNVKQTSPVFSMTFQNGHNVVWDKKRECLWSAGQSALYKFAYNQTTGALTEITHYDFPAGNTGAHDFVKIWNEDKYIMTTEQNTYVFDPNTNTFTKSDSFQPNDIKSVSTGPKGFRTICAVPEESWWTSHVLDYNTGEQVFERTGAKIYKVRYWLWEE